MFCFQYSFLLTLVLFCTFSGSVSCAEDVEEQDLRNSLDRVLDFLINDSHNVDVDCLFGVVIAEAQLNVLLKEPPLVLNKLAYIQKLRDKCRKLFDSVKSGITPPNEQYAKIMEKVLRVEAWQRHVTFTDGLLQDLPLLPWPAHEQFLATVMFEGSPNESESDACIAELVDQGPTDTLHRCAPGAGCDEVMLQLGADVHGYPLTHKLLYVQVARSVNCTIEPASRPASTALLCSRILQEFRTIQVLNSPLLHDLYLEQMVLCGTEGYTEFLQPSATHLVIQWQQHMGCYGYLNDDNNSSGLDAEQGAVGGRTKRNSLPMSAGCDSHMTGLGTAALALNLRHLHRIKTPSNL